MRRGVKRGKETHALAAIDEHLGLLGRPLLPGLLLWMLEVCVVWRVARSDLAHLSALVRLVVDGCVVSETPWLDEAGSRGKG